MRVPPPTRARCEELQTPRFKPGLNGDLVPDVRAEAAIIYNPVTHEILWEENAQNARSIASITKVMTAVVFLEHASESRLRRSKFCPWIRAPLRRRICGHGIA